MIAGRIILEARMSSSNISMTQFKLPTCFTDTSKKQKFQKKLSAHEIKSPHTVPFFCNILFI